MENRDHLKTSRMNWGRIILLSALVVLIFGTGLWLWQSSSGAIKDRSTENGNVNSRSTSESTKPLILENNPPGSNSQLELVGDKLSEALFHLREQQTDAATQTLAEALELARKSDDDPQMRQNLLNGIKEVQIDLENNRSNEAEQTINSLLNELNMPEN